MALAGAWSCTKDFDEINTDPDAYTTAPSSNMLAYCQTTQASSLADITGWTLWSGYMSKLNYPDNYSDLLPSNNTYGNKWYNFYFIHTQMQDVVDRTNQQETKNQQNVAKVMQDWGMLLASDLFGDIPYFDAFKGAQGEEYLKTKFDPQSEVYPALINDLLGVADSWAAGLGSDEIGGGDLFFGGDASAWQKFCNSLILRYAMRLSGKNGKDAVWPEAKSVVAKILGNPSSYPLIDENSEGLYFNWLNSTAYYEPWFNTYNTRHNDWGVSELFVDFLKANNDPRLYVYAQPARTDGEYRGAPHGIAANQLANLMSYSLPGEAYMTANPAGFTPYYKACETYFLKAEAILDGYVSGDAKEAYETAVKLSMEDEKDHSDTFVPADRQITSAKIDEYLAGAGAWDGSYDRLYNEEWVALFKESAESWTFYRRTGYPTGIQTATYSAADAAAQVGNCVEGERQYLGANAEGYWGKGVHTDVPFRMPYPNNQYMYNTDNVNAAVASQGIVNHSWGGQLWWDTRDGVK